MQMPLINGCLHQGGQGAQTFDLRDPSVGLMGGMFLTYSMRLLMK